MTLKVNRERLENNIKKLSEYGQNCNGGVDRSIGSQADFEARKWLCNYCKSLGAEIKIDAIANIFATIHGLECKKKIVIGSHHDAVPNGGKYDGAMGVLLGIEIMQVLVENEIKLRHPYEVLMFTAEEPNPFSISTMGSRSVTGKIPLEVLKRARNCQNEMKLSEAIYRVGGNIDELLKSQLSPEEMSSFIECHIEQSNNLDQMNLPVASVRAITGIYREVVTVTGESNHAGTTPMSFRYDALAAASECILSIESIAKEFSRSDIVATVGKLDVKPNAANIIPGSVSFIMEIRTPNEIEKNEFLNQISETFERVKKDRKIEIKREINLNQESVQMDKMIQNVLNEEIIKEQGKPVSLISMAGHDAVHMTELTQTGMLFVRSVDGKSHCAEEYTRTEDIEKAGNVLLNAVLKLDKILN